MRRTQEVLISNSKSVHTWVVIPLLSVTHGQCDARPTVTFRAAERHRIILFCGRSTRARARARACVCERLAQGCCLEAGSGTRDHMSSALSTTSLSDSALLT